jgi:hypothetical protein
MNGNVERGYILNVPYSERNEAKALGAWWDPDLRKWFVPQGLEEGPFKRWNPVKPERSGEQTKR